MVDVSLSPLGAGWQFLDDSGNILSGGRLYTYEAGGTMPIDSYTSSAGNVSNGVYVQLDSAGRPPAEIWQVEGQDYKYVLKKFVSTGVYSDIRTYDNIPGIIGASFGPSFAQLASTTNPSGASLVGNLGGGTVQDGIFVKGRQTPVAGSKMAVLWMRDDVSFPLEDEGGIWTDDVVTQTGLNATFDASDGGAGSPCVSLFVEANNNGSPGDIVALLSDAVARANSTIVFGANVIARGGAAHSGVKYVGLEVDVVPNAGDTSIDSGSGGIFLNIFNKAISGPAMQIGGTAGTFGNGIVIGGIAAAGTAITLEAGADCQSLISTTVGTFHASAITMGEGAARGMRWQNSGITKTAQQYFDGTNLLCVLPNNGYWSFRNDNDSATLLSIEEPTGSVNIEASGGVYKVLGNQVVGPRLTAVTAPTGGATVDSQARTAINDIISRLQTHGLIS